MDTSLLTDWQLAELVTASGLGFAVAWLALSMRALRRRVDRLEADRPDGEDRHQAPG